MMLRERLPVRALVLTLTAVAASVTFAPVIEHLGDKLGTIVAAYVLWLTITPLSSYNHYRCLIFLFFAG